MELTPVSSSSIAAVGHDPASNTLTVEFTNGNRYRYFDVPAAVHAELLAAPSPGRHFAEVIRGGGFSYERVTEEKPAAE